MPSITRNVPKNGDLHRHLTKMISSRIKFAQKRQQEKHDAWQKAEDTILAYVPENDLDAKRRRKREENGEPKYTTIKLPYTYALLMSAHTYLTSVFFARSPIHQFAGRHGETEQQIQMLEATVAYQTEVGQMLGPYYLWIYDSLKYGIGCIEEYWDKEVIQYAMIQEAPDPSRPGEILKQQITVRSEGYQGNKVGNISPFDFLPDPRVSVANFQKGEFVFVRKRLGWSQIIKRKAQGYYTNIDELKGGGENDFAGTDNHGSSQLDRPEDEQQLTEADGLNHPSRVTVYEGCIEIVPKEWKLGESDFPEKWMFTITGDLATIIGAQPHGAAHGKFPYAVLESEVEAYGSYKRGLPEIAEGIQNTMDWLINQHFFNVRAALNNQFIIDPSKIVARDAEKGGAGFVYRLRPEAYGQDIRSFFHQIPVADVTSGHINDIQSMFGLGEKTFGVNEQMMGALGSGGRKTATEIRTSTGFGVNRLKTMAEYMSATDFSQHAQRLVQTTQQYYSGEQKLRIVGSLAQEAGEKAAMNFLSVKREGLQGFYDFVPVDGTLPIDRLAQANMWREILVQMRSMPTLMMQYDLGKIFAHVAHLAGVRNVNQFKVELGSPEGLAQQADAGNLVGVGGSKPNAPAGVGSAGAGNAMLPA